MVAHAVAVTVSVPTLVIVTAKHRCQDAVAVDLEVAGSVRPKVSILVIIELYSFHQLFDSFTLK